MARGFDVNRPPTPDRKIRKQKPVDYYNKAKSKARTSEGNRSSQIIKDEDQDKLDSKDDSSTLSEPPPNVDEIFDQPSVRLKFKAKQRTAETTEASMPASSRTTKVATKGQARVSRPSRNQDNIELAETTAAVQDPTRYNLKRKAPLEMTKAVKKKHKKIELSPEEKQRQEEAEKQRQEEEKQRQEEEKQRQEEEKQRREEEKQRQEKAEQRRFVMLGRLENLSDLAEDIESIGLPVRLSDRLLALARDHLKVFLSTSSPSETCSTIIQRQIDRIVGNVDRRARPEEWHNDGVRDTINMLWSVLSTGKDATAEDHVHEIEYLRKEVQKKDDLLATQAECFTAELGKAQTEKVQIQTLQLKLSKEDIVSELRRQLIAAQSTITKLQSEKAAWETKHQAQVTKHDREMEQEKTHFKNRMIKLQDDNKKQREAKELAVRGLKKDITKKEKEARNAKMDKLEAKISEWEQEIVNHRNENAMLTMQVRHLTAEYAKHGTAMQQLAADYEQWMSAERRDSTKKHMVRLLASMSKIHHAENRFKHEQTLRHEATEKTERFRIQNSNNIALADRLNRGIRVMEKAHVERIAQMQEEIAELKNQRYEVEQENDRLTELVQNIKSDMVASAMPFETEASSTVDRHEHIESRATTPAQIDESYEQSDDGGVTVNDQMNEREGSLDVSEEEQSTSDDVDVDGGAAENGGGAED